MTIGGVRKDDDVWKGDDVELFLSIGEAPKPYRHFIVNPGNLQWDGRSPESLVGGNDDDVSWDAQWQSGVHTGEDQWTAELAIPWDALGGRPEPGALRRANLCRQRSRTGELSTWSQMLRSFLEPEAFGVWQFS